MEAEQVIHVSVPVSTEVINANPDCSVSGAYQDGALVITIDTRKQNVHQRLGLGTRTKLHFSRENEFFAQELSGLLWPIRYRVLTREGYYTGSDGQRVHFTTLAESGMRVLRRLEVEHDGFRSKEGRENCLRIYQAVKYLGWSVHRLPESEANSS